MINIPNSAIAVPNYAEQETLDRLSTAVVITKERKQMGLNWCEKLRENLKSTAKPNLNVEQNKNDGLEGAKYSEYRVVVENVLNMDVNERRKMSA
jgi:hypothetical protein